MSDTELARLLGPKEPLFGARFPDGVVRVLTTWDLYLYNAGLKPEYKKYFG